MFVNAGWKSSISAIVPVCLFQFGWWQVSHYYEIIFLSNLRFLGKKTFLGPTLCHIRGSLHKDEVTPRSRAALSGQALWSLRQSLSTLNSTFRTSRHKIPQLDQDCSAMQITYTSIFPTCKPTTHFSTPLMDLWTLNPFICSFSECCLNSLWLVVINQWRIFLLQVSKNMGFKH